MADTRLPHELVTDLAWLSDRLQTEGRTQAGLAKALGRDVSAISRMLDGERDIKAREVSAIYAYCTTSAGTGGAAPSHSEGPPEAGGVGDIAVSLQSIDYSLCLMCAQLDKLVGTSSQAAIIRVEEAQRRFRGNA